LIAKRKEEAMDVLSRKDFGTHLATVAWMRIAYSGLLLMGGLFVGTILAGIGAATHDAVAHEILGTVGAVVGGSMLILSVPGLVAGIGLLSRASWSRVMALVLSAFDLLAFPIGTLLAAYTVFVLSQQAAVDAFGTCCEIEENRVKAAAA
jgi:hypothetical protein